MGLSMIYIHRCRCKLVDLFSRVNPVKLVFSGVIVVLSLALLCVKWNLKNLRLLIMLFPCFSISPLFQDVIFALLGMSQVFLSTSFCPSSPPHLSLHVILSPPLPPYSCFHCTLCVHKTNSANEGLRCETRYIHFWKNQLFLMLLYARTCVKRFSGGFDEVCVGFWPKALCTSDSR